MGKTFRVRGVPHGWSRDDLQSFLKQKASSEPEIGSLALEVHRRTQTATLTFQDDSSQLQDILTVKKLEIPPQLLHKQSTRAASLVFDCDFGGITTLYAPCLQDHQVDIIAISGLGGHAFGSFKERGGNHMWLRDALPYDITGGDNNIPISRVMIHGYDSSLQNSDSFQNLEDLGTSFYSSLRSMAIADSYRPIILIAHSLGGLIVKETLISLSKSNDEEDQNLLRAVYGIAFFGVPHDGMDIKSLISMAGDGPNRFLLESIGNQSSQILGIYNRDFPHSLGGQGESKIICFYETRLSPTATLDEKGNWEMTGTAAVLVSKSSATHSRPWETGQQYICAINRTHSEMVKFSSEDSEYEKVVGRIQSLVREARRAHEVQALIAQKRALQPTLSQQAQNCLKSLAFDSMRSRSLEVESAVSGTCEWLLQHETFRSWSELNQAILWIKGKPGSGKSTLLNYTFTKQKQLLSARDSDLVLSFFFHGRGGDLQKTPLGLFRSLLYQILKQIPDCLSNFVDIFENNCKVIGEHGKEWQWHPEELWSAFESSLPEILKGRSVWLFIDALDESGEDNAKDLVKKFKLLFKRANDPSAGTNHLHICFSCRHYPILDSPGLAEVCLEEENRADICTYVQSELSSSEEQISSTIEDSIIERASGVFLWAQLVVKRIQKLTIEGAGPNHIKAAVDSLPKDLESLFKELIRGMTPASVRLIQWIHFATRPLSIEELRWAMAIDAGCISLQACQNAMDYVPDDKHMRQRIMSLSQGLAEITSGTGTHIVQFIHQSVKDFFLDKGFLALHGNFTSIEMAIGMSHLYLFNTCIRYLAMEEVGTLAIGTAEPDHMDTDFPFLNYAITSWVSHMKQSDDHGTPAEHFLEMLSWPSNDLVALWTKVGKWMRGFSRKYSPETTSLVHIVARHGIQGTMNVILQRLGQVTVEADLKDGNGQTPLSLAAEQGHTTIVEVLLATGHVDINANDKFNRTPLSWAAKNGHEAVVKLLLAKDPANINSKDEYNRTPLSLAAEKGHKAVVELLLATGQADINSKTNFNRTPLSWAARNGHEAVVKLLLATDKAYINSKDEYNRTPLSLAAEKGHKAVVKLLLAKDPANINSKDEYNRTPLSLAAEKGHKAVVELLLATDQANINSKDKYNRTPLSLAAENGHEAVVNLLQDYARSHT
ncbi:hypothetical protein TGAM01_v206549 [Trichoderma gamsii]|uniref:Nephrocystin 3-like N-terminal domain-containing protein n=1 Tax=Trichoderma gamsii TaxID=398673 RepID=A0A2P4ZJZ3_9HYPO|nr:hypothetical protein TGAM01_v206549 [Trichoderma gamsii]PON24619.1 hypothetical protein TGAM01_v206549 [Trichoderma gamsii]